MTSPQDHNDEHSPEEEVPDGAAVFPLVPPELGVQPLLLSTLHALVFLAASEDTVVHETAAEEALQYMLTYLRRLKGPQRDRVREDMVCLLEFARQDGWGEAEIHLLQHVFEQFLTEFDEDGEDEAKT